MILVRAWLGCIALAACGRIGFDARGDGAGDGLAGLGPFGPATEVPGLSSGGIDEDPSLTGDMLELIFNSDRTGGGDIYRSTRQSVTDPWGAPQLVTELSTASLENTPEISLDGLTIWFSSDRNSAGNQQIWVATRPTRNDPWSPPQLAAGGVNTAANDVAAFVLPDELVMYLVNNAVAADSNDIYMATRTSTTAPWSAQMHVVELSAPGFDSDPWVSADGTVIYWSSVRTGQPELWRANRAAQGATPFEQLEPVTELNTSLMEDDPWLSPDGHTIYFSRGVDFATQMSIFMATR